MSSTAQPPVPAAGDASEQSPLENELAVLLVESLNLEVAPADIVPTAPLYGEGLGLDSIDILEVALEVSRTLRLPAAFGRRAQPADLPVAAQPSRRACRGGTAAAS